MKRLFLALGALVLVLLPAAWFGAPAMLHQPLLDLNRGLSGLQEKTVSAAGHRVHYLDGGQGEPLVLLHGIFAEKDHWVDFARPLTGGWRVIAPDLPGFGESGRHAGQAYTYARQVERLKELLDALALQRVHLAGNSMGGTLAALFAMRYPERVASVALIGSPHGIRSPQPSEMDRLIDAGQAPLVAATSEDFGRMMELVFAARPWLPYPVLHAAESSALRDAASNRRLWNEQLADRYLLDARIAGLRHPTLVLWGDADRVFHPTGAEALRARLPHAQVTMVPGIGHLPMMEAPAPTAGAYAGFLRGLPGGERPAP